LPKVIVPGFDPNFAAAASVQQRDRLWQQSRLPNLCGVIPSPDEFIMNDGGIPQFTPASETYE
jgi:hypothetical protein